MRNNATHCKYCRFFCPTFGVKKYGVCCLSSITAKKVRPQDFSCEAFCAKNVKGGEA